MVKRTFSGVAFGWKKLRFPPEPPRRRAAGAWGQRPHQPDLSFEPCVSPGKRFLFFAALEFLQRATCYPLRGFLLSSGNVTMIRVIEEEQTRSTYKDGSGNILTQLKGAHERVPFHGNERGLAIQQRTGGFFFQCGGFLLV